MRTKVSLILSLSLLLLAVPNARAQQAETYASVDSVTVGDRFELTVVLGHDGTRKAIFPHDLIPDSLQANAIFSLGDFEILDVLRRGSRPYDAGGQIDSVVYETTTFALDTARVAGIPVGLAAAGDTMTALAPGTFVRIGSLVPDDATELKDLAPIAEFDRAWWPWILGLLALAAVIGALWWRRRNTEDEENEDDFVPEPAIPPYQEAVDRLAALQQIDLADPEQVKPFYVELTDILRTYVGRRANVPALETTTRELLDRLRTAAKSGPLPEEVIKEIDQVLSHADLVKFADLRPILEQTRSMVDETRGAIEDTESVYREEEMRREQARRAALEAAQYAPPKKALEDA